MGIEAARMRTMNPKSELRGVIVLCIALIALFLKLALAFNTVGTNDAVFFYGSAQVISQHGLTWLYQHSIYFNHPPLTGYYLHAIYLLAEQNWCREIGIHFLFLLRLPGIIADFIVVLVLLRMSKPDCGLGLPTWALALFALSPVSLMISGFHGNTDSVMVMFLVCAAFMSLRERPVLCGLFFAMSCQIKIIPLLLCPAFLFFWFARGKGLRFLFSVGLLSAVLWAEPLLRCPGWFLKNVFSYGSYWGIWGVTYCLRLTGFDRFSRVSFFALSPAQNAIVIALKVVIIVTAVMIAWRRRHLAGPALLNSLAYTWIVFFVFAPGVCAQYLVWLAPFVLVLSPALYSWLLAASSTFLFVFYTVTSRGFPWMVSVSMDEVREQWAPWSLLPWTVLVVGLILLSRKTAEINRAFWLFSFETLRAKNA
jgi:uncharacterized membrane protein